MRPKSLGGTRIDSGFLRRAAIILANDPFNRKIPEIKKLTPTQIAEIFFCERDDKGKVIFRDEGESVDNLSSWELFKEHAFHELGITDETQLRRIFAIRKEKEMRLAEELKNREVELVEEEYS